MKKKVLPVIIAFCIWMCCSSAFASSDGSLKVAWQAVTTNTDGSVIDNLAGYRLYVGMESGVYNTVHDIPPGNTKYEVKNLEVGVKYFLAITAYNTYDKESGKSTEISSDGKYYFVPSKVLGFIEITAENVYIDADIVNIGAPGL